MAQAVPVGGSRGSWGRHTGRAAPARLTGVHSCTSARSLWKVRGSNLGGSGAASAPRAVRVPSPARRVWGLPSHLGVGQDAVHRHLLSGLPPGTLGQRHRPQKLVRGAAGRAADDTQYKSAADSLETLPSARRHHPASPHAQLFPTPTPALGA